MMRFFSGVGRRVAWCVAAAVAAVVVTSFLASDWTLPVAACSAVALLAVFHGHGTGCTACGRWWARSEVERGLVAHEEMDADGLPCERLLSQTTYQCTRCGHRWSLTTAEGEAKPRPAEDSPRHAGGRPDLRGSDRKARSRPARPRHPAGADGAEPDRPGRRRRESRDATARRPAEGPRRRP